MQFVKACDLKRGMRIGRPIFNKRGELVYDRDRKITDADIVKIRSLKIMGIFTLDPAEPLPPVSEIGMEYEKQRFVNVYALRDEMQEMQVLHRAHRIERIADSIISSFGGIKRRIEFPQSIRSRDEYVCCHSVDVAILSILLANQVGMSGSDKKSLVYSALLHDIGKYVVPDSVLKDETVEETERILFNAQDVGFELIGNVLDDHRVVNTCIEAHKILRNLRFGRKQEGDKPSLVTKILVVADSFDSMTAIDATGGVVPNSYISALRYMRIYPEVFDMRVIEALEAAINIITIGSTVLLNNKKQALVMSLSGDDILRPTVLEVESNRVCNLEEQKNRDLEIVDVVNTLDNRHVVDR